MRRGPRSVREELRQAISAEDYEKAARIRDRIKRTEDENSDGI